MNSEDQTSESNWRRWPDGSPRPDLMDTLLPNVDMKEVQRLRIIADKQLELEKFKPIAAAINALPTLSDLSSPPAVRLSDDHVTIGQSSDLNSQQQLSVAAAIESLAPWRKGPFRIFGNEIDAEWRSNLKWDRIAGALGELRGRKVLDVGCGNGYYMLRAAASNPAAVLGLDPSTTFYYAFEMFQRYLQNENLQYDRLGCEHLYVFDQAFDIALCMGILYHHRSPIEILRSLKRSIKVGGFAIIESQTIPGDGTIALFPEDRYAKARNVFFMPTKDCLVNWIKRSGFKDVEVVSHTKVTFDEQRSTKNMTWESLSDFLDPNDPGLTIEGYPAPYRTVVKAFRKFL
jgi:tRNA (mo5U34)-methyltransferase